MATSDWSFQPQEKKNKISPSLIQGPCNRISRVEYSCLLIRGFSVTPYPHHHKILPDLSTEKILANYLRVETHQQLSNISGLMVMILSNTENLKLWCLSAAD